MNFKEPHINYLTIPGVIYTHPEVANVGYTEENLKEKGLLNTKTKYKNKFYLEKEKK